MSYFKLNRLPKEKRIRMLGEFYDVIASLKNREEVREFFKDLFTPNELGNLMSRIEVALLLSLGFSYDEIYKLLGVGKDKILNVNKKLERGKGYKIAIERLLEKRRKRKIEEIKKQLKLARKMKPYNIEHLKKKYPLYFLVSNLVDELADHLEAISKLKSPKEEMREFYQKESRTI
jgi:TrpR-related protein YerC/YecD